jgi:diguanylate cyclase (GGDEF)-like protein
MVIALRPRADGGAMARTRRLRGPAPSYCFAGCGALAVLAIVLNAPTLVGEYVLLALGLATLAAIAIGVRLIRPSVTWPFWSIEAALSLFVGGMAIRPQLHNLGYLTASRALAPDLVILPGYVLLGTGLLGFAWLRSRGSGHGLDAVLDGTMAMLALAALLWTFVIDPELSLHRTTLPVRVVIVAYPALSCFLVAVVLRMAYGPGERHIPAFRFLVPSLVFLLAGDMLYMLAEIGIVHPSGRINVPYGLAFAFAGAAVLHPSMRAATEPAKGPDPTSYKTRIPLVAAGLAVPAAVIAGRRNLPSGDSAVLSIIVLALTAAAILRIVQALRSAARSEDRLTHQATHDSLTGLPNRRLMQRQLERALLRGNDVALLFLDLDRFKLVNDTLGHSHGDQLLMLLAGRLCEHVRPDDVVTRIGGDEFVVIIERSGGPEEAREVADRLRQSIREPFVIDGSEFFLSASVGLAYSARGETSRDAEMLLREADTAMYQAKDAGRDAVAVFNGWMQTRMAERLELENHLRHAVDRREFHLLYQPIVTLPGGAVEGVEALVRWNHPTYGVLAPARFVPLAEESGLIGEIGRWVLDEATRQLGMWANRASQSELYVAVNLSAAQLYDDGLVDQVERAIRRSGIRPGALCLELTESVMMDDPARMMSTLAALRKLGVQLAIDDFGTEYSSLAYLKRFPVQRLKIDRSFVENIEDVDNPEATIVSAMVALAHALGLATVAEGVETAAQAKRLVELGCDGAQGYLYGRPVKASQLAELASFLQSPHEPAWWSSSWEPAALQQAADG